MKRKLSLIVIGLILVGVMLLALAGCGAKEETTTTAPPATTVTPGTAAFVMMGLNNDFFIALKGAFEEGFQAAGWKTEVTSGEFNPQTQLTAVENYIAAGVDVLFIWEVVPGSLDAVAQQAMDAGIKIIAFVQPLANFDAGMTVDNSQLAMDLMYNASLWTEEALKDATTINVALITMDNTAIVKEQADVIKANLATIIPTAKIVTSYDITAESVEAGVTAAENIYTTNPEVNLILTVNAAAALGANNYFTGVSSPLKDYSKLGIFTANGASELYDPIEASGTDAAPLRGTVVTAGIGQTIADMLALANGAMSGEYSNKFMMYGKVLFVNASTLEEYKTTGDVTTISESQFKK